MKLVVFNTKILMDELDRLTENITKTKKEGERWLYYQRDRADWGNTDQAGTAHARMAFEQELMDLRERMATVYDFMGDRGFVNFEPPEFVAALRGEDDILGE